MPVLENPREERFAQARAKGLCADAAYVAAGYKAHRGNASRMSANENVQARIAEIQARAEEKFTLSRIEWLEWFKRGARKAEENEDVSALRGCLREIGLAMPGWYAPEKSEVAVTEHSHKAAVERIRKRK